MNLTAKWIELNGLVFVMVLWSWVQLIIQITKKHSSNRKIEMFKKRRMNSGRGLSVVWRCSKSTNRYNLETNWIKSICRIVRLLEEPKNSLSSKDLHKSAIKYRGFWGKQCDLYLIDWLKNSDLYVYQWLLI